MGIFWKGLHHPTCLHTPQKSVQSQLKKLGTNRGLGKRLATLHPTGLTEPILSLEIAIASSFDAPEQDLEAESPAPRLGKR
jgi:hypothetical protein